MVWTKRRVRLTGLFILIGLSITGIYFYYTELRPVVIFGLRQDFAHAIPFQRIPTGISGIRAEDCGQCHTEIYAEWKSSVHSQAFVDPFFQAFWKKDKRIWVCLNCHTPLENQQPDLVLEIPRNRVEKAVKTSNPNYDPDFRLEGNSCASCHVRDGVIQGPFEDSKAPHPTRYDPIYRTTRLCYRCHQVPSGPFQFYKFGPCGTYPEYEGGPYYKTGYICQTCHMPEIERSVAIGGPIRKGRRHLWRGGHDPEQVKKAVTIRLKSDHPNMKPGESVRFTLTFTNSGAGHYLPTGDPDRYFTIEFQILDQHDHILKKESHTIGRWIIWQPIIWEVYGNRLKPMESREFTFQYQLPESVQIDSRLKFRTIIEYHIQSEGTHKMLITKYGLTSNDPFKFTVFEHEVQLPGPFIETVQGIEESGQPVETQFNHMACSGTVKKAG